MIRCKVCDTGELVHRRKYRMSGIVVVIGYILVVPSVLGMLIGGFMLVATGFGAGSTFETLKSAARQHLEAEAVPASVVSKVVESTPLTRADSALLTDAHLRAVESVSLSLSAGAAGAGLGASIAGGISLLVIVMSLVGGLLGWLLIMKRTVLQCSHCGAVTAAS